MLDNLDSVVEEINIPVKVVLVLRSRNLFYLAKIQGIKLENTRDSV